MSSKSTVQRTGVLQYIRLSLPATPDVSVQARLQGNEGSNVRLLFGESISKEALESAEEIFYTFSTDTERIKTLLNVTVEGELATTSTGEVDETTILVTDLDLDGVSKTA